MLYYSPEHMETVMRRAAATGIIAGQDDVPAHLVLGLREAGKNASAARRLSAAQGAARPPPRPAAGKPADVLSALWGGLVGQPRPARGDGGAPRPVPAGTEAQQGGRARLYGSGADAPDRADLDDLDMFKQQRFLARRRRKSQAKGRPRNRARPLTQKPEKTQPERPGPHCERPSGASRRHAAHKSEFMIGISMPVVG